MNQEVEESERYAKQKTSDDFKLADIPTIEGLPYYTMEEVSKHKTKKLKVWITYGHGVYDITTYIPLHPGGDELLAGAGSSMEHCFALYPIHKKPLTLAILEELRIGNLQLATEDQDSEAQGSSLPLDPETQVINEKMTIIHENPYVAEPPADKLLTYITPNEWFCVQYNLPMVNEIDIKAYNVFISGIGIQPKTLSFFEIMKNYEKYSVEITVQCAGNRQTEMNKIRPIQGPMWTIGGISNALWSGAKLCDVLTSAGFKEDCPDACHVQFEGKDNYSASIPIQNAIDPRCDVLLAYEMNNKQLPRKHGFPIRIIVPGVAGFRSVKHVVNIKVTREECSSRWQQSLYRMYLPNITKVTEKTVAGPTVQASPVISAITNLMSGQTVYLIDSNFDVKGYAYSGGGCMITRVDVSADSGKTWTVANITSQAKTIPPYHWTWSLWEASIPISSHKMGQVEIWVKAVDSSYNIQPENMESIWNIKGIFCNAYHKIQVNIAWHDAK